MSVVVGELACTTVAIRNTLEHNVPFEISYDKILDKIYINYPYLFFSSAILVNAFISIFYFYVNIANIRTSIIRFSIVKKMWKAKADFNHVSRRY